MAETDRGERLKTSTNCDVRGLALNASYGETNMATKIKVKNC
jgi:hypothetical protein